MSFLCLCDLLCSSQLNILLATLELSKFETDLLFQVKSVQSWSENMGLVVTLKLWASWSEGLLFLSVFVQNSTWTVKSAF